MKFAWIDRLFAGFLLQYDGITQHEGNHCHLCQYRGSTALQYCTLILSELIFLFVTVVEPVFLEHPRGPTERMSIVH